MARTRSWNDRFSFCKKTSDRPFYALQALGLDGESQPHQRIEDMAACYIKAMQAVQPLGPYILVGHSFGSWVAFEMAKQVQEKGHEIALLAVIDFWEPMTNNSVLTSIEPI